MISAYKKKSPEPDKADFELPLIRELRNGANFAEGSRAAVIHSIDLTEIFTGHHRGEDVREVEEGRACVGISFIHLKFIQDYESI